MDQVVKKVHCENKLNCDSFRKNRKQQVTEELRAYTEIKNVTNLKQIR